MFALYFWLDAVMYQRKNILGLICFISNLLSILFCFVLSLFWGPRIWTFSFKFCFVLFYVHFKRKHIMLFEKGVFCHSQLVLVTQWSCMCFFCFGFAVLSFLIFCLFCWLLKRHTVVTLSISLLIFNSFLLHKFWCSIFAFNIYMSS